MRRKIKLASLLVVVLLTSTINTAIAGDSVSMQPAIAKSLVVNHFILVRKESRKAGAEGPIFAVTEFEIDYDNNRLTRLSDHPNGIEDLTANTVFEFDQSGNLISQRDIDDRGTASIKQFIYDSEGQLTNLNGFMASNGNPSSTWEYSYFPDGKLERKLETSGEPAKAKTYSYDDQGRLITIVHQRGGQGGQLNDTYVERFEHDLVTGQIIVQESFNTKGESFGVSSRYQYDTNGNMIAIEWFKGDDLTHVDQFFYELKPLPIFNYWLHINRFFPEWMRYEV